ncbi:MAG: SurA N-terminal domain-containing protein, partial [Rickettsiales bacterium]|nr:SurA N-terminal domain-containing protein [Rickettsiales bacterium]
MVGTIRKAKAARSRFLLGVLVTIFILYSLSGILFVISNRYNVIVGEGKKLHINEFFNIWNAEKQSSYNPSMSTREIAYIGSKEFMADVLNRLVDSKLIELEVENFAVRKPDELVLKVISEEKSFHSNGSFDFAKFENFLKQGGLTELDLVEKVRDNENKKFLMDALSSVPLVNETEIEVLQEENNLNRDVKIFSIEQSKLKKGAKEVSEDDVRQYYYRNVQKFTAPETRKIDYIKLTNYRPSRS